MEAQIGKYKNEINEILTFAKNKGYDLKNLTKEMLDEIMKLWIKNTKRFHESFKETPLCVQKSLLKIS